MNKKIWKNKLMDKHRWAFYYFCIRQGDRVWLEWRGKNKADIHVRINKLKEQTNNKS